MKLPVILLALFPVTIFFRVCSKEEKVETSETSEIISYSSGVSEITADKIEEKNGLFYEVNQTTPLTGLVQDMYPNGKKRLEIPFKDGKLHGRYLEWDENGMIWCEEHYEDGKGLFTSRRGAKATWLESGHKWSETTIISSGEPTPRPVRVITADKIEKGYGGVYYELYQTTPFTGLVQEMYPNGQKKSAVYWKDGAKQYESNYKDGMFHGAYTKWHENGKKKSERNYTDGKLHGVSTQWDENGKKTRETRYKNGVKKN